MVGRVNKAVWLAVLSLAAASAACAETADNGEFTPTEQDIDSVQSAHWASTTIPNGKDFLNWGGFAATWSTQGDLDLTNEFHTAQGTNGRSCGSCHLPDGGWSITPLQVEVKFWLTEGTDPLFNPLDANTPTSDVSTKQARYASYSMLRKGLFRRGGTLPATRQFDITAAADPFGYGSTSRFSVFRRPLATSNFKLAKNVSWDDNNTRSGQTVRVGLENQANNNVNSGQGGPLLPTTDPIIQSIVDYEESLFFAQTEVWGVGKLDKHGGKGGPEHLAEQAFVAGRFNLYDAWIDIDKGKGKKDHKKSLMAQIARGQEIFNNKGRPDGRGSCLGCHNSENNGSNVNGTVFDIGASDERWASRDNLPIYTVKDRTTGAEKRTTDPGKANRTGNWADMNKFKVPSLRGLTARAPFFHNGYAKTLRDVVEFYEQSLGFQYTPQEEEDLIAFMNAL